MSAEACTLTVVEVDEFREALSDQREAIVRILTEADAARNGVGVTWEILCEAVGIIARSITTVEDTLDQRVGEARPEERSANDG